MEKARSRRRLFIEEVPDRAARCKFILGLGEGFFFVFFFLGGWLGVQSYILSFWGWGTKSWSPSQPQPRSSHLLPIVNNRYFHVPVPCIRQIALPRLHGARYFHFHFHFHFPCHMRRFPGTRLQMARHSTWLTRRLRSQALPSHIPSLHTTLIHARPMQITFLVLAHAQ